MKFLQLVSHQEIPLLYSYHSMLQGFPSTADLDFSAEEGEPEGRQEKSESSRPFYSLSQGTRRLPSCIGKNNAAAEHEQGQKQAGVQVTFGTVRLISFSIASHVDCQYTQTWWKIKEKHFTAMQDEVFHSQKGLYREG